MSKKKIMLSEQERKSLEMIDDVNQIKGEDMKRFLKILNNDELIDNYNKAIMTLHIDYLVEKLKKDDLFFNQSYRLIKKLKDLCEFELDDETLEEVFCYLYIYSQYALLDVRLRQASKKYNVRRNRLYKAIESRKSKIHKDLKENNPELLEYFNMFEGLGEYEMKLYRLIMNKIIFLLKDMFDIAFVDFAATINNFEDELDVKANTLQKSYKAFKIKVDDYYKTIKQLEILKQEQEQEQKEEPKIDKEQVQEELDSQLYDDFFL